MSAARSGLRSAVPLPQAWELPRRFGSTPSAILELSARSCGGVRREKGPAGSRPSAWAVRAGVRHARSNPHLRATLIRGAAFFLFGSGYWALLPLVARNQIAGGPDLYGLLLGLIGAGAVGGAFALPWLKAKLGADRLVAAGTVGTAITLILF